MSTLGGLLWHHIHVGLQNDTFLILVARGGGLAEMNITGRILHGIYASLLSEVNQELLDFVEMSTGTGYLCQCIEILPDALGLKFLNFVHSFILLNIGFCH